MGVPLRRSDGTLVSADKFALVERMPLADAGPADQWRGQKGHGTPVGTPGNQGGHSQATDIADTSGFGRAWWNDSSDIPKHVSAGREYVITTDRDLQLGPEPGRIARINDRRIGGMIGPDVQNSIPADGNWGYMEHQKVGKLTTNAMPALRTIADDAWLPGVFAGNPL